MNAFKRDKWFRRGRILAVACRYVGVIVLTYTVTAVTCVKDEFSRSVEAPLGAVTGPNWIDEVSHLRDGLSLALWYVVREEAALEMELGKEEDRELVAWAEKLRAALQQATELEKSVIEGTAIQPIGRHTWNNTGGNLSGGVWDAFYGTPPPAPTPTPSTGGDGAGNAATGRGVKSREDLNNEALREWNRVMKEDDYALLRIPGNAALYPYQQEIRISLWTGCGLLVVGAAPLLWKWGQRRMGRRSVATP